MTSRDAKIMKFADHNDDSITFDDYHDDEIMTF